MTDDFNSNEDKLIRIIDKLSKTISTFDTLSRVQAENAILETTSKINDCNNLLKSMEQNLINTSLDEMSKHELNSKLTNYKTEYQKLVNKFKIIQDSYINKKAASALIDESQINEASEAGEPKQKQQIKGLVANEANISNSNANEFSVSPNNTDTNINDTNQKPGIMKLNNSENKNMGNQGNIGMRISHIEVDEGFNNLQKLNKSRSLKKKKTIAGIVALCCIIISTAIVLIIVFAK